MTVCTTAARKHIVEAIRR